MWTVYCPYMGNAITLDTFFQTWRKPCRESLKPTLSA
jgi:hypothetical protein